ncbi:MAG: alkaline phosphatase family protein [Phycisphaerales bacterium]|nr:alkaline phosphatase family protein [Phycisphaerales bacterium]
MSPEDKPKPRVVLVAVESALLASDKAWLESNGAISLASRGIMKTFPGWTTTLVTGVDPLIHDIIDSTIIDPETLEPRPINSEDCRFSSIWLEGSEFGLAMSSVDWPGSNLSTTIDHAITPADMGRKIQDMPARPEDAEIALAVVPEDEQSKLVAIQRMKAISMLSRARLNLEEAERVLESSEPPDFLTLGIRDSQFLQKAGVDLDPIRTINRGLLQSFIEGIPRGTICIVAERIAGTAAQSEQNDSDHVPTGFVFHIFGCEADPGEFKMAAISTAAPTIRNLLGLPHPLGASNAIWPFLAVDDAENQQRPLPKFFEANPADHVDVARRALELPEGTPQEKQTRTQAIKALTRQAEERARIAQIKFDWKSLATPARALTMLRGSGRDYWQLFIAQERLRQFKEMHETLKDMMEHHPNKPMTMIAKALAILPKDPDQTRAILEEVDVDSIKMPLVYSGLGRTAAAVGMHDIAIQALQKVIANGTPIPMDRITLARTYGQLGRPEDGLKAMAGIGKVRGSPEARMLRAELHLQASQPAEAANIAKVILQGNPADSKAQSILARAQQALSSA